MVLENPVYAYYDDNFLPPAKYFINYSSFSTFEAYFVTFPFSLSVLVVELYGFTFGRKLPDFEGSSFTNFTYSFL